MSKITTRLLDDDVEIGSFDCCNPSINELIKESFFATLVNQGHAYRIFVDDRVVGYYMLRLVSVENYSDKYSTALFTNFSAIKVEYLAIDRNCQKRGIGNNVARLIFAQINKICEKLPIRYITIEAVLEKVGWYEKMDFKHYNVSGGNPATAVMFLDLIDWRRVDSYLGSVV